MPPQKLINSNLSKFLNLPDSRDDQVPISFASPLWMSLNNVKSCTWQSGLIDKQTVVFIFSVSSTFSQNLGNYICRKLGGSWWIPIIVMSNLYSGLWLLCHVQLNAIPKKNMKSKDMWGVQGYRYHKTSGFSAVI